MARADGELIVAKQSRRHRQHVNPLALGALVRRPPLQLPNDRRIEIELGCGDGQFLLDRAVRDEAAYFLGLDIRDEFLERGRKKIALQGISNVSLETCNFLVDAPHLFAANSVERFFINFPDPLFKRRTRNRRWFDADCLEHLVHALTPSGEIFFQSDVWEPALSALAVLESSAQLTNVAGGWTFLRENPYSATSTRERFCLENGLQIWRMLFRKRKLRPLETQATQ